MPLGRKLGSSVRRLILAEVQVEWMFWAARLQKFFDANSVYVEK